MLRPRERSLVAVLLFVAVIYVLMSLAIALVTANHCSSPPGQHRSWVYVPPHWECTR